MLKIFVVVMLLVPGMPEPQVQRTEVENAQECFDRLQLVKDKAVELNAKGGPTSEFKVMVGCQFLSEKSDPA